MRKIAGRRQGGFGLALLLLTLLVIGPLVVAQAPPPPQDNASLTLPIVGIGTIERSPAGIESYGSFWYEAGTEVTLTPINGEGFWFTGWSGDHIGTETPLTITVVVGEFTNNTTITATFEPFWTLTVDVAPAASGDVQIVEGTVPGGYPATREFLEGTLVTLVALPGLGWDFVEWTGDLEGTDLAGVVLIDGDKDVTANFVLHEYTLDVFMNGDGAVVRSPDQATYHYGDVVQLDANAELGWHFAAWGEDLAGSANPATIAIDGDKTVTASFVLDEYVLDVNVVGQGTVSKDPLQATYHYGDVVNLCALADPNWELVGWSGDVVGTDTCIAVTMDGHKAVVATFVQTEFTLVTTVDPAGSGTVTGGGVYTAGLVATVAATPINSCWEFTGWSGDLSGSVNPTTILMDEDSAVTAHFAQIEYTLTTIASPAAGGTVIGGGIYACGDTAEVQAVAAAGYDFVGWEGDLFGAGNPDDVVMDGNKSVTAVFEVEYPTWCTRLLMPGWNLVSTPLIPAGGAGTPGLLGWEDGVVSIDVDGSGADTVVFGVSPSALDGIDYSNDVPNPPTAFAPYVDGWFEIGSEKFGTFIKSPVGSDETKSWTLTVADEGSASQVVLSWDVPAIVGASEYVKSVTLTDATAGVQVDMQNVGSYTYAKLSDPERRTLTITVVCRTSTGGAFGDSISPVILYRLDACTGAYIAVDDADVIPGESYWLWVYEEDTDLCVTGTPVGEDLIVPLPCEGWSQISSPWDYPKHAIGFTDGIETKTWEEAVAAHWVENAVWRYDAEEGEYVYMDGGSVLAPWVGYWMLTYEDGLSMILDYESRSSLGSMSAKISSRAVANAPRPPAAPMAPTTNPGDSADGYGLAVTNWPNPIRDVNTTTFTAMSSKGFVIEAIKVQILDLSGRIVFEDERFGDELVWHTDNNAGEYLANGTYIYRVSVLINGGWIITEVRKLAIVR